MTLLAEHLSVACDPYYDVNCSEPTFWDSVADFFGSVVDFLWPWPLLLLLAVALLCVSVEIVGEKRALIIERLGKFHSVMQAGLNFRIPFLDRVAATMELDIKQIKEDVKVKTSDNVSVTLPVVIHYRVQEHSVREAFYELARPEEVIQSLVLHAIKSAVAGMTLQEVFNSRDQLDVEVKTDLIAKVGTYGYEITDVVVNDPRVSPELEAAFDDVTAAAQRQAAATADAEALKITSIGEATAQAQAMEISARATVEQRKTIAAGFAEAIQSMTASTGVTGSEVLRYFLVTDGNDAIRDSSRNGATVVVASPSHQDGLYATLPSHNGNHSSHVSS